MTRSANATEPELLEAIKEEAPVDLEATAAEIQQLDTTLKETKPY